MAYDLHGNIGTSPPVEVVSQNVLFFNLSVAVHGMGAGNVRGGGIDCTTGGTSGCTSRLADGSPVRLIATPDGSSVFAGWSGACTGTGDCELTLTDHTAVVATFQPQVCNVVVQPRGSGLGLVTGSGLSCAMGGTGVCTVQVPYGAGVALAAAAGEDTVFAGWSGGWCAGTGDCAFTVTEHVTVVARFEAAFFPLSVTILGTGGGTVAGVPGLACTSVAGAPSPSSTCNVKVANGQVVTPTATPDAASLFGGWGTTCTGTGSCTLKMNSAKALLARFEAGSYPLTVTTSGMGAVAATGAELTCPANATRVVQVANGASVTLAATPDPGWTFVRWTGGGCSGGGSCAVVMGAAQNVLATFQPATYRLTVIAAGTGTGTVECPLGTISCPKTVRDLQAESSVEVPNGATVNLVATAGASTVVGGWSGCTLGANGCAVTMTGPKTVTTTFQPSQYQLAVSMGGSGSGKVTGAGLDCGLGATTCSKPLDNGTTASLTATPDASSVFGSWGIVCTGTGACNIKMNSDKTVSARFDPGSYPLSVAVSGSGKVSAPGIDCGPGTTGDCSESVGNGSSVTLTATPGTNAVFAGWSGACTGPGPCVVTMSTARSVTATFQPDSYPLTIAFAGQGTGIVAGEGLSCSSGPPCTRDVANGATLVLRASPLGDSVVGAWSGCTPVADGCSVTMTGARTVTATFHPGQVALSVALAGTGLGRVIGEGIACGLGATSCTTTIQNGVVRTLQAEAAEGSLFGGWSGACSGTGPCMVTMSEPRSVVATFLANTHPLTVSILGSASGAVSGAGVSCSGAPGTNCTASLTRDSSVLLTAVPTGTALFSGWSGACSGTGTCTVAMTSAKGVGATFQPAGYSLTVQLGGAGAGKVTGGGLDCGDGGSICKVQVVPGTTVSLGQVPRGDSIFTGWGIVCTGTGPCNVKMNSSKTVLATFQPSTYRVTVTVVGNGTVSGPGLSCSSGTCTTDRPYGSGVSLVAAPGAGSTFSRWTGNCRGSTPTCTLTMTSPWATTATFTTP